MFWQYISIGHPVYGLKYDKFSDEIMNALKENKKLDVITIILAELGPCN